jgi:hypothetical protein
VTRKALLALLFGFGLICPELSAANIIVAPGAPHDGAGTFASPMSLWRALGTVDASGALLRRNPASLVSPGDHIRLRAGVYRYTLPYEPLLGNTILGLWGVYTQGSPDRPIWIEPYGDGAVIIDGNLSGNPYVSSLHRNFTVWSLEASSRYTHVFNIRITNSDPANRILSSAPPQCPPWSADESNRCDARGIGYDDRGVGNRAIHVQIDNTGTGFFLSNTSSGMEWCISRLNGWDALDRTHGHGAYIQSDNSQGQKTITDSIIFGNLANELNVRGSSNASVNNILFLRDAFYSGRVLVGDPLDLDITFSSFYGFQQRNQNYVLTIGESSLPNSGITVQDSYLYSRNGGGNSNHNGLEINHAENAIVRRNTILADNNVSLIPSTSNPPPSNFIFNDNNYNQGALNSPYMATYNGSVKTFSDWQALATTFDSRSVFNSPSKFSSTVLGHASPWIAGYSMLVIFNPAGGDSVTLNAPFLKSLGYATGNSITLTNVQDYDHDVITIANWDGQDYTLDMRPAARGQAMPLGISKAAMNNPTDYDDFANSFPYFGTFVVQRQSSAQGSVQPFSLPDRAAAVLETNGGGNSTGYAVLQPRAGSPAPGGVAIYEFRENGLLVSETATPATPLVSAGRTFVELGGPLDTGIALANASSTPAAISFYFTDSSGRDFGHNAFTVAAGQQIAKFIDEPPFGLKGPFVGTLTFASSSPVAVVAIREFINERHHALLSAQAVAPVSNVESGPRLFAQFANGGGWTTQIVLVNQSDKAVSGTLQLIDQGTVLFPAGVLSEFNYSIAARSFTRWGTTAAAPTTQVGSVRVIPALGSLSPFGFAVVSLADQGFTLTQTSLPQDDVGSVFRLFFETSGLSGALTPSQTGIAIANPSAARASVNFELMRLDGASTGLTTSATVPANGQMSRFVGELFPSVISPFRGLVRISSSIPVAITGLLAKYNEEGDFLIAAIPVSNEALPPKTSSLVFPQLVDGGGYSTQFILYSAAPGQISSGNIQFFDPSGRALPLTFK